MQKPEIPEDEMERMAILRAMNILDTAPEERFDRLTRLAKRMFDVPISLISLVDEERQWFKSSQGLEVSETPRDISFCGHAILGDDIFLVENALEDQRFADNPLVTDTPNIRFYAGCPLKMTNGHKIGTLCLIDDKPRVLNDEDKILLKDLAIMAEQEIATMQLASLDELTLVSNRSGFLSLAKHAINMCIRNSAAATMVVFNLDDFNAINVQFGHAEGDVALRAFALLLKQEFRDSDVFARIGGDEFVVLLTNTGRNQIESAMERFQNSVTLYNEQSNRGYEIYYSAGYTSKDRVEDVCIEEMLNEANAIMYEKKQQKQII